MRASDRLARMTGGARWIETAQPDRTRRARRQSLPPWVTRTTSYSAALWQSEHEITVRCVPTRPRANSSPTEIAFALAGLEGAPLLMGELILLDDQSVRADLVAEGVEIAARMPWPKNVERRMLCKLVDLAVFEVERCDGTVTHYARAAHLRVHRETWRRRYAPTYESHLYPTVSAWSGVMLDHVSRRL